MTTEGGLRCGIAIPQIFGVRRIDAGLLQMFLRRAEELGYESLWVQEQILGRGVSSLEPVTLLGYAASVTRTLRLGTAVLLTPLRSPVQLAKALATVDQLSDGRLVAGIGLGANTQIYPAFGISAERRVRRFIEGLQVMKRLWTEERVTFAGEFWKLADVLMEPKPVQKPHPPVWFGGGHPNVLRRAATLADGWMGAGSSSTEGFRTRVAQLHGFLTETRRDPSTFPISKRVYLAVDPDTARAQDRLRRWFEGYYGSAELADRVALAGNTAAVTAGLLEIREAGATHILLNPVFDELRHLELLAREIVPAIR